MLFAQAWRRCMYLSYLLFLFAYIAGLGSTFALLGLVITSVVAAASYAWARLHLPPNNGFYVRSELTGKQVKWAEHTFLR